MALKPDSFTHMGTVCTGDGESRTASWVPSDSRLPLLPPKGGGVVRPEQEFNSTFFIHGNSMGTNGLQGKYWVSLRRNIAIPPP